MSTPVRVEAGLPRVPVTAVLTGWSLHLPSVPASAAADPAVAALLAEPSVGAADASRVLGRKGLLAKEPATRLALLAVHRALGLEPGARPAGDPDPDTAVVACSNLGNVETVATVARAVRAHGLREVSPLLAPNASSNVLASSVALWFRFGGPNLMICSGATAGLDGLTVAVRLLRAGRARRVVLVGAEPDDPVARAIRSGPGRPGPLRAGAACAVLAAGDPTGGGAGVFVDRDTGGYARQTVGPQYSGRSFDPAADWYDVYGANGVVNLVVGAALAAAGGGPVLVRCGDRLDGLRSAMVRGGAGG